ncbi:tetratricopeptide repeat protein 21B [Tribolium castaneum]|uniref:tetratricopeptide repeat protein 21B n=1 Tax=Tribolium castaneum TaxID=7070 RepID=UPI0001757E8A|nr:PREDICTED: tetratricopeptide repeat protein 21B [Tribolium castaneum]XP_974217.2 PREDICTED: tetratricopeptide repeat protein 21B [Tribolium castaneum]|eukprot:XP_015840637.1 PREDICTED: tetratricopeptide repeat protein 21B [Tribolium castaneum]
MEDQSDYRSNVFFYFREKYYNLMIAACKESAAKFKTESSYRLYQALALLLNNRLEESINEFDALKNENTVKLSATIGLMYANKILGVSNKELFHKLDSQVREYRKSAEAIDFCNSGFVLFVLNKPEKALDYIDKSLNIQSDLVEALALKGWVLLHLKKLGHRVSQNITEIFEQALKDNKRNLDAILGVSESYLTQNKFEEALDAVNKAIVRYPKSVLPLIQKMKIQFASQDWEPTVETMNRIINDKIDNLDAQKINILILLSRDANYDEATVCIKKYFHEIEIQEPKNGKILSDSAKLFSRICGRHVDVLKETHKMAERAIQINSEDVEFIVELGHQCLLSSRIKEAQKYYKTASKLNESSLKALMGLTLCELSENGKSDQIKKQVDFLLELEDAQNSPQLYLIRAKICDNSDEALIFLKKASDLQLSLVKHQYYSDAYLLSLDPDFMLDVVREFLQYISYSSDFNSVRVTSSAASTALNALKVVTKSCPGLYEASFLLAKLQYLTGDTTNAMTTLEQILAKVEDESSSEAHLLMAQIQVQNGYYERAAQSLEVGLSYNFKVRENPMFHYIRGLVDKNLNNVPDSIKFLTTALTLVSLSPQSTTYKSKDQSDLTLIERASIYIELIEAHNTIGQNDEAAKLLETAVEEFQGTPEEARILILSADHAVKRKNVQGAIDLLNKVKPNETYYLQARTKLADILLKHRLDSYAYLQCYQDMVDENPGPESYLLLGDAYMTILEPDEALECYNQALQQNPKDPHLALKMGQALVKTHYFARAVAFYKEAINTIQDPELRLQLGELYISMKEYDKAESLLSSELKNDKSLDDLTQLQYKTKLSMLLAQAREKSGNLPGALTILREARENQNRVRKRLAVEQTNVPEDEIKLLLDIGVKLAEIAATLKDNDKAVQFYKDALEISPSSTEILTALAKLYMQMNELDSCQQICTNILSLDPENENASVMMADIAFRKIDFDMALFHFTQLISKQPTNWTALVRLVEVMRRTGNLTDFPEYLTNAEKKTQNPVKDPGFLFCTALYQWYSGNLNGALRNFNASRQDATWGQQALYNMIEICLNPDDEMLGDQFVDSEDIEYRDSRSMALKTAERLLRELKHRLEAGGDDMLRYRLLVNFRLLATQEKYNIEKGLEDFISLGSQNMYKDNVGPVLGMVTAYTLLKQSQRAKNQLKRVAKATWTFEDAEYLERCWLLLADYYIQSSKYDVANDLLTKVVQHNKTCSKAHELLGFICEKEQHFKDAVVSYEAAWRFGGKTNVGIGYKLAYSLMKSKNYADAIDVGQQVLKLSPDYGKIKKDVLDKCLNNLRV